MSSDEDRSDRGLEPYEHEHDWREVRSTSSGRLLSAFCGICGLSSVDGIYQSMYEQMTRERDDLLAGHTDEYLTARLKVLRPQPGDVLVITGIDIPPEEYREGWYKALNDAVPDGVKTILIESEDADVRLERGSDGLLLSRDSSSGDAS